jgi:hypothetical protein
VNTDIPEQVLDKVQMQILNIPIAKLATMCAEPEILATVLSIVYNHGYQQGQQQAHRYYRMMLTGQDDVTVTNQGVQNGTAY